MSTANEAEPTDYFLVLHALNSIRANVKVIDLNTLVLRDGENLCATFCFDDPGKFVRVFNHTSTLQHQPVSDLQTLERAFKAIGVPYEADTDTEGQIAIYASDGQSWAFYFDSATDKYIRSRSA